MIQNLKDNDIVSDNYYGIYCVLKNIILRGTPTPPSQFLRQRLGNLDVNNDCKHVLISDDLPVWVNTIKGEEKTGDNPALHFFNELIPKYFGKYVFVKQLMLPEVPILDIIPNANLEFYDQVVDFYIPQAKLVIEIDGSQHKEEVQKAKDDQRDALFYKYGIYTVRIDTAYINYESNNLSQKIKEIIDVLDKSPEIQVYKRAYEVNEKTDSELLQISYDIVIRFEILIISLLQKNSIKITDNSWRFVLLYADENLEYLFKIAIEDLFLWLAHLCKLRKIHYNTPSIVIGSVEDPLNEAISVDFSMFKRWTDEAELSQNQNTIYVRNDYFDNNDYFQISTSDSIQYDLVIEGEKSDVDSLLFILKNVFGFDEFRDGQLPILVNILRKIDTIGILPTGSGKSLCYQFAAILQPCISFVICPILALIYDQKENLDRKGITRTNYITSDLKGYEKDNIIKDFKSGKYLFLWISPERFQVQNFRDSLRDLNITRNFAIAVIDEVHCLSEWGHDFRTSYLTLVKTIREYCPEASLLGLTATASQFVLNDLKNEFEIDSSNIKTTSSMNRSELNFHLVIVNKESKYNELLGVLKNLEQKLGGNLFNIEGENTKCGLIFTVNKGSKDGCINLAQELSKSFNQTIKAYHGELGREKKVVQEEYKLNEFPLLVATKAFGMGVDKGNIRYTIHYSLPWSIEAFYQEAGRAGRDRANADCYILYKQETCDPQIIDEIFDLNTDMENLDQLCENLSNDLNKIMFLWKQNNKGIKRDLEVMIWVMQNLFVGSSSVIVCNDTFKKSEVEKAIYRLGILGLINDWTIEDWGETTAKIKVSLNNYSVETVKDSLFAYIRRYDPEFSETSSHSKHVEYIEILNDNTLKPYVRLMKVLLKWSYDNIVYQRRQTIKNMKDLCDNFSGNDYLRKYIDNYFRFSDRTILLDQVAYSPKEYKNWFEAFYEYRDIDNLRKAKFPITRAGAESLIPTIQRYLESYRYNTGLNYISGMARLLCDEFEHSDGLPRLEEAFNNIEGFSSQDYDEIITQTLEIGKQADERNRELLGEFLLRRNPKRAKQIYKAIKDSSSLLHMLSDSVEKLNKFKENILW